jgi:hypothetical protein
LFVRFLFGPDSCLSGPPACRRAPFSDPKSFSFTGSSTPILEQYQVFLAPILPSKSPLKKIKGLANHIVPFCILVGTGGFEPPAPCSQGRCADQTALRPEYFSVESLARIFHELLAATTDMAVLPGVLGCRPLRRTVQVRLGTNPAIPRDELPGGTPILFALAALRSVPQAGSQLRGLATAVHEISGLKVGNLVSQGRVQCKGKTRRVLSVVRGPWSVALGARSIGQRVGG